MHMKKTILFTLLALLGMTQAVAQESDGYLSIVREGVKWVNEKVIVNHGDTTRYYYNYEFSGKDTDIQYTNIQNDLFDACYYYLGEQLNVEQDSLIAGLLDNYVAQGEIHCMRNHAYEKVRNENRQMFDLLYYLDGGSRKLYNFYKYYSTIHYYVNQCEYMWCQYTGDEPELTEANFIEVDPVMVEGVECWRYAYIDENGEPLAYVVEGIGFDSRDMGDLLTPFTRQPDPDADYQEWCGLSHVVKDGQIIYKGMRYRHGAFTGIDETVADTTQRPADPNYYNLMGQPVGKDVPTSPGIYIHNGKKIVVR
jgi:hypothetical protein